MAKKLITFFRSGEKAVRGEVVRRLLISFQMLSVTDGLYENYGRVRYPKVEVGTQCGGMQQVGGWGKAKGRTDSEEVGRRGECDGFRNGGWTGVSKRSRAED